MTLLAFLTTKCAPCQQFWEMLADPEARAALGTKVAVVTPSPSMENRRRAQELAPAGVELHMGSETWFDYAVTQAGTFVLVRDAPDGRPAWEGPDGGAVIGSAEPASSAELLDLVARWLSSCPS